MIVEPPSNLIDKWVQSAVAWQ